MVTGIVKGEDATGWCAGEVCGSMWGCKFDGVFFSHFEDMDGFGKT